MKRSEINAMIRADNRFLEPIGRFPDIEEDVPAEVLIS